MLLTGKRLAFEIDSTLTTQSGEKVFCGSIWQGVHPCQEEPEGKEECLGGQQIKKEERPEPTAGVTGDLRWGLGQGCRLPPGVKQEKNETK